MNIWRRWVLDVILVFFTLVAEKGKLENCETRFALSSHTPFVTIQNERFQGIDYIFVHIVHK